MLLKYAPSKWAFFFFFSFFLVVDSRSIIGCFLPRMGIRFVSSLAAKPACVRAPELGRACAEGGRPCIVQTL